VDIVGANVYNRFLQQETECKTSLSGYDLITDPTYLSAKTCESILVCTGVYDPTKDTTVEREHWKIPTTIQDDVLAAVKYVLNKEGFSTDF